jgi:hypothetical protein
MRCIVRKLRNRQARDFPRMCKQAFHESSA